MTEKHQLHILEHFQQENSLQIDEPPGWLYGEIYKPDEIDRSVTLLLLEGFSYKEMYYSSGKE